MLDPDGETAAVYRKIHLVPFGEFFPLQRAGCSFVRAARRGAVVVFLRRACHDGASPWKGTCEHGHLLRGGVPALVRDAVLQGSELLTTITNDAWYGSRLRRFSTSRWRRCARSSRDATWCAPPTPASAASSIPTAACWSGSDLFETVAIVGDARFVTAERSMPQIGDLVAYLAWRRTALRWLLALARSGPGF